MILYNVTVNIEPEIEADWLHWMKNKHIPDVLNTGYFVENKLFKLLHEPENPGCTYSVQYFARTIQDINGYLQNEAPRLQGEHLDRYGRQFVAFRTLLEEVR